MTDQGSLGVLVARIAVMITFGGLGVVMFGVGLVQFFRQRRLLTNATPIEVEILVSEVFRSTSVEVGKELLRDRSTTSHRPDVRFRYRVGDTDYESDLLRPTIIVRSYASHDAAAAELEPFPVGARVRGWVDPWHPDKAFLVAEKSAAPAVFVVVGFLLPIVAWFGGLLI